MLFLGLLSPFSFSRIHYYFVDRLTRLLPSFCTLIFKFPGFLSSFLASFFLSYLSGDAYSSHLYSFFLSSWRYILPKSVFLPFFLFSWCYIVSVTIIAPFRRSFFFVLPSFFSSLFLLIFAFFYFILVVNFINITNLDLQSFIFFSLISFLTGDIFLPNH